MEGRAAWEKFPERKRYLNSVLKEMGELATHRLGAMGSAGGAADQRLRARQQGRDNSRAAIWKAGCEGSGRREAAELSVASHWEGLRGHSGTCFPMLRQMAPSSVVRESLQDSLLATSSLSSPPASVNGCPC